MWINFVNKLPNLILTPFFENNSSWPSYYIKPVYDDTSHQNTPLSRILGIKFIHAPLISLASSFKYTDTTNGFKGYSFRLIRDLLGKLESNHLDKYGMHIYLSIAANKFGYKCKEVGVIRQYPSNKKIPTKISFFKGNLNILFELIKIIILFRKI